jgi:tRNA A-37 threonylcarbamoyl transferase component Bud32/tetratricopeptide (TPR) repeat protein
MGRVDLVVSARAGGLTKLGVLKRMRPELRTPEQEVRFRRESSIALRLTHATIAQTIDALDVEGEPCILQEFVHGTTLARLEQRAAAAGEKIPVPLALHIACEIARALAYAHSFEGGGIVHRDVTPDNVMLSFSGEVKLVDFGIAKSVTEAPLTQVGLVVGRPLYTAPEIFAGQPATARSDIYSLGIVLWQVLTGRAFPGPSEATGTSPPPPPSAENLDVSPEVDAAVMRAVAPRPEERYERAEDFQAALIKLIRAGFVADRALVGFLARHFNVDRERRELAEDIEKAQAMLAPEARTAEGGGVDVSRKPRVSRSVVVAVTVALAGAGVIGAYRAGRRASSQLIHDSAPATSAPAQHASPTVSTEPPLQRERVPEPIPRVEAIPRPRATSTIERASTRRDTGALLRESDRRFKSGDLPAALDLARDAAREGAGVDAQLMMGKVFYAQNKLAEAEAAFERATRLNPRSAEAQRYLDLVRRDLGEEKH